MLALLKAKANNFSLSSGSCNNFLTKIISAPIDFNVAAASNVRVPDLCVKLFVSTIIPDSIIDASKGKNVISGL